MDSPSTCSCLMMGFFATQGTHLNEGHVCVCLTNYPPYTSLPSVHLLVPLWALIQRKRYSCVISFLIHLCIFKECFQLGSEITCAHFIFVQINSSFKHLIFRVCPKLLCKPENIELSMLDI